MTLTERLLALYRVDQQLRSLRTRVDGAEKYLTQQDRLLAELQTQKARLEAQIKSVSAHAANLETDVKALEERIAGLRAQMNRATSNKEYSAFLSEIKTFEKEKDKVETDAISHLSQVDELRTQLADLEKQLEDRARIREVALSQRDQCRAEVGERLAELERQRAAAGKDLPASAIEQFKTMSDWHDGEAMAEVIEEDARRMEYACGACNMSIPVERISALLSRGDITICPSCNRILYLGSSVEEAIRDRISGT